MATAPTINREWIATQFSKGIEAEQVLVDDAQARAQAPPEPALTVLYNEIAVDDERHRTMIETIAIRYGHTPSRSVAGGIGETLARLKEKVGELGTTPLQKLGHDLTAKANVIHWCTAWIEAFQAIGDSESARDLGTVLNEEKAHHRALQESLNRMILRGATGENKALQ